MADQSIVIVDAQGTEHEFPEGFDPHKAASIVRQYVLDNLKSANRQPLKEPTTYAGGVLRSVGDTVGRTVKGAAEGVLSVVDPRTYIDVAKTGAGLFTDPVGTSVRAGESIVDEAQRIASGDPEAGGRAIGQLATAIVAPRVVPEVPGYIQRARDYLASKAPGRAGVLRAAKAVAKEGSILKAGEKGIAKAVLDKLDPDARVTAVQAALKESLAQPTELQPRLVKPTEKPSGAVPGFDRYMPNTSGAEASVVPPSEPIVAASGKMKLTGPEFAEWQRLVKNGQTMPEAYATVQAQRAARPASPPETSTAAPAPQPAPESATPEAGSAPAVDPVQSAVQALMQEGMSEPEAVQAVEWLQQGVRPQVAWNRIQAQRAAVKGSALGKSMTNAEVAAEIAARKGNRSPRRRP